MLPEFAGIIDSNSLVYIIEIATSNKEIYTDILRRIRDNIRRKCPEKWGNNSWFLFTTMLLYTGRFWSWIFLAKKQCDNTTILLT